VCVCVCVCVYARSGVCRDARCVAVYCSVLQCVAVGCSDLQCVAHSLFENARPGVYRAARLASALQCFAVWCMCCSVLQCVAVCCSVLQCVAVYCSVLKITATLSLIASSPNRCLNPKHLCKSAQYFRKRARYL